MRHGEQSTLEAAMERYADGDASALAAIYDGVVPRIRTYAQRHVDNGRVEGIVEDVMRALVERRGDYVPGAPVLPWAFSFARASLAAIAEADGPQPRDDEDATFTAPLRDQVGRLPEPLRSTLELVWLEEFSPSQAAELLGTSPRTIQAWTRRAFEMLEAIGREADETDEHVPEHAASRSHTVLDNDPDLCGTVAGARYRIGNEIGSGGMAVVYEAVDLETNREVALKVLKDGRDHTEVQRFGNEFKALHKLGNHPNIVQVIEEGDLRGGQPFYVMERLSGQTLKDVLAGGRRLEWARVARIVKQVCDALAEVHSKGFVHRDIKPSNVFLVQDESGRELVKLIDFGIVHEKDADPQADQLTRPGAIPGTYAYVAPERTNNKKADARSDVYSLGITMFEALTGRRPFWVPGGDVLELAASLAKPVPTMRKVCPTGVFTEQIEAIVRRAIEREPDDRFQDVGELARAIAALDAKGHGRLPFVPRPARERARNVLLGASAAMTLGTLAIAGIVESGDDDRLPFVGPALGPAHIDAGLTSIAELLTRCHSPNEDAPTQPVRITFTVLGATGEVIDAKAHAPESDSPRAKCLQDAMYRARFNTFGASKQSIERDL